MGLIRAIIEKADKADFSVLGGLYLWPGNLVKVGGAAYLGVMMAGAVLVALALGWTVLAVRRMMRARPRARYPDHLAGLTLAFALMGGYVTLVYPPTTDEPHYLVLAESILSDHNLTVANEYRDRAWLKFYPAREIDAHAVITPDGEMHSQHTAGLPLLVLAPYALAGRWGIALLMAFLSALLFHLLYRLARDSGVAHPPAAAAAGLAAVTVPLVCTFSLVFTELPAAVLVSAALVRRRDRWTGPLVAAALPWLHPRYAVLSAGFMALHLYENGATMRALARWILVPGLSAAGFSLVYRGPALTAILNVITEKYPSRMEDLTGGALSAMAFANPLTALMGKLLDRDFGLIPYAPAWLAVIPGMAIVARRASPANRAALLAGLPYLVVTCIYRNWGGSAFPGRTLVPLVPFMAPYLAAGLARLSLSAMGRIATGLAVAWGLWTAFLLTACPVLRYTSGRLWLEAKMGALARVIPATAFPSYADPSAGLLLASLGTLTVLVAASFAGRSGRR